MKLELTDQLEIKDICPQWSDALSTGKTDKRLSIGNERLCMVGEAHGFSDKYESTCPQCYTFCLEFAWCIHGSTVADRYASAEENEEQREFYVWDAVEYKILERLFLEHFNKVHKEEWYERRL
jgi:hypothetical protein